MDESAADGHFNQWFSSYGLITIERLFAHYSIKLPAQALPVIIKKQQGFYHHLIEIPIKNVLNGIILQQANDYHIYVQKLFIDYLLSGRSEESEGDSNLSVKESLEEARLQLVSLGEAFQEKMKEHEAIVASSQAFLIRITSEWRLSFQKAINQLQLALEQAGVNKPKSAIEQAVHHALIHADWLSGLSSERPERLLIAMNERIALPLVGGVKELCLKALEHLTPHMREFKSSRGQYLEAIALMKQDAQSFRIQFYQHSLSTRQYLAQLSEYTLNSQQDALNQEALYFDSTIGVEEDSTGG